MGSFGPKLVARNDALFHGPTLRIGLRTYCQLSQPRRVSSTTLARSASSRPAKQA